MGFPVGGAARAGAVHASTCCSRNGRGRHRRRGHRRRLRVAGAPCPAGVFDESTCRYVDKWVSRCVGFDRKKKGPPGVIPAALSAYPLRLPASRTDAVPLSVPGTAPSLGSAVPALSLDVLHRPIPDPSWMRRCGAKLSVPERRMCGYTRPCVPAEARPRPATSLLVHSSRHPGVDGGVGSPPVVPDFLGERMGQGGAPPCPWALGASKPREKPRERHGLASERPHEGLPVGRRPVHSDTSMSRLVEPSTCRKGAWANPPPRGGGPGAMPFAVAPGTEPLLGLGPSGDAPFRGALSGGRYATAGCPAGARRRVPRPFVC